MLGTAVLAFAQEINSLAQWQFMFASTVSSQGSALGNQTLTHNIHGVHKVDIQDFWF